MNISPLLWIHCNFVSAIVCRVFLALAEDPKDRGTIVAQGGGKVCLCHSFSSLDVSWFAFAANIVKHFCPCVQALIPLALEGTETGKVKASFALAKIAAVSNPEMAFPGERVRLSAVTTSMISLSCTLKQQFTEAEHNNLPQTLCVPIFTSTVEMFLIW